MIKYFSPDTNSIPRLIRTVQADFARVCVVKQHEPQCSRRVEILHASVKTHGALLQNPDICAFKSSDLSAVSRPSLAQTQLCQRGRILHFTFCKVCCKPPLIA